MTDEKVKGSRLKSSRGVLFVAFLWLIQSVGRLYFAILGTPSGMGRFLDVPISYTTSLVMFIMFLFLGILGLVAAFGLFGRQKWGFWCTILVSAATIGFIVPAISILYFCPKKSQLLAS